MTPAVPPRHFRSGEGKSYRLGGITLTFKLSAAETAKAYTLCEAVEPAGSGASLHRHFSYDETHIICEGQYDCQLGEQMLKRGPGDMMFVPKGTPHSIRCAGPQTGRELIISSPGGIFDAFIEEVATLLGASGAAPSATPAADFGTIAAKYGIEFLA